tara:strand:+ start:429 stop:809 length:381 start_codon:yes stop_codon:yes gene_type:complete
MPLKKTYPEWFTKIWDAYPNYPTGRSKKYESFQVAERLKRDDGWEDAEINELVDIIEKWAANAETWQRNSQFGPPGLQVFLRDRRYENEIPEKQKRPLHPSELAERNQEFIRRREEETLKRLQAVR